jgi:uncharacterized repeat protein (TIGR03843 family)
MSESRLLEDTLRILTNGEIESLGLMPWGSNYTFLVQLTESRAKGKSSQPDSDTQEVLAVYKPRRGEAPLWDFPTGTLCLREFAAYLVSDALGWQLVPPTVLRNGPHGFGSVQLFIDNDPNQHFFTFREEEAACIQLQRMALFDLITNNADRKSGHCLRDKQGHVWAIDHGITFNSDYKLRTVIWDYAGQPIQPQMLADMKQLRADIDANRPLGKALRKLLDDDEIRAFTKRLDGLIKLGAFPSPNRYERSTPWPPV